MTMGFDMSTVTAKNVTVKLEADIRERIQHLAQARDRSAHWIMRQAIGQYVEREEKREAFRQDTLRAWEEYRRTGLHLTGEEMDAWMARLEAGEDAELPACHR